MNQLSRILAIDTTGIVGSVALVESDGVHEHLIEQVLLHSPEGFGQVLFDTLRELLHRHAWRLEAVDCFAVANGPGSFTGVRIGLTAVKGLAEALTKPIIGVSTLQAIAFSGSAPIRAALLDARRGEVFGGVYDATLAVVQQEVVAPLAQWLDQLPPGVQVLSPSIDLFAAQVQARGLNAAHSPGGLAHATACIAARRFAAGTVDDVLAVEANYVRRSDVELQWKDR